MYKTILLPAAFFTLLTAVTGCASSEATPIIGGPCDGCELVFVGLPSNLDAEARLAPVKEPGAPLLLEGTVRRGDGSPAPDVVIYAYHTDANGIYPKGDTVHGRLRGWARTGERGEYRFHTIRPGAYPALNTAEHIHMHVIEPKKGTYYIENITFSDDPLLKREVVRPEETARGGAGMTHPEISGGRWYIRRDIILGKNIPGY